MALLMTIATKLDERGIRKAQHSFKRLTGSMKGMLGGALGALGIGLSVRQLMDMAKAADADAKSAALLADNLKKLAGATSTQIGFSETFIQKLSNQVGIVDDNLRPALTELAAVTKDVTKAQELLVAVLDISKGRGKSQEAVQKAVAKAYAGNTTALTRMFPEMKKTEAAFKANHKGALSMADSVKLGKDMIQQLADQNQGNAEKMASPFDKMMTSVDNLKENIGGALLPIIEKLIPKIQEMVNAFGKPDSPESQALKGMGDALLIAFSAIDNMSKAISGNTAIVMFLDSIKNFALGLSLVLESTMAIIDAFQGKAFDPKKYPALNAYSQNSINNKKNQTTRINANTSANQIWNQQRALTQQGGKGMGFGNGVTINVNGVVGDKVAVGKAVTEAINAYKKTNGQK
jgi:hypothetical protein